MCQSAPSLRFMCALVMLSAFDMAACGGDDREHAEDSHTHGQKVFDSADPASSLPGVNDTDRSQGGGADGDGSTTGASTYYPTVALGVGGQPRAQRDGNVVAVLGEDGALSVVDIDAGKVLSRHYNRWGETPLRLELQGHVAIALLRDPSNTDDASVMTGTLLALDIATPKRPRVVSELTIKGNITDVARSGDVLLVLADQGAMSALTSFDISDPTALAQVSSLSFAESRTGTLYWKSHFALSGSRVYVYTPDAAHKAALSFVDVVDLSSAGVMHAGKRLTVGGAVMSPGYISESGGVLRVLGAWVPQLAPSEHVIVQTFRIASADDIEPIAKVDLSLADTFGNATIDGDRAYVISLVGTPEAITGSLGLIDLSDPAAPVMAGSIDFGPPVAFLPLQDRVLLASNVGAMQIRLDLIDVTNGAEPSSIAHQTLTDADGKPRSQAALSLMQLFGSSTLAVGYSSTVTGCIDDDTGRVQLFELADDSLAPDRSVDTGPPPFQMLSAAQSLVFVMNRYVARFDLDASDAQDQLTSVAIAREVTSSVALDDQLVRFAKDGSFDVTTFDRAELPDARRFELPGTKGSLCPWATWATRVGDRVHAIRWEEARVTAQQMLLSTIDFASDPSAPKVAGPMVMKRPFKTLLPEQAVTCGESFAFAGAALASYWYVNEASGGKDRLRNFVDVAAIDDLAHGSTQSFELPATISGLLAGDGVVASSHAEPDADGRVRFYLDRFDVSDAKAPRALPKLNIPGSLLAIDAQLDRAITVDYEREALRDVTRAECASRFGERAGFSGTDGSDALGTCERRVDTIRLVSITHEVVAIEDSFELPHELRLLDATAGELNVVGRAADRTGHQAVIVHAATDDTLEVDLVDLNGKTFERPAISDSRAFLIGLGSDDGNTGVIDLSAAHPKLRVLDVPGPVQHVSTHEDTAFFSLGPSGLAAIDLSAAGAH